MDAVTPERLREVLQYDPDTGIFVWRGTVAPIGTFDRSVGYLRIRIGRRNYLAHRLAWLYMTGEWPVSLIDHWDQDGVNNRWGNLRQATKATNGANRGKPSTNTTGLKGVSICKATGRWRSDIRAHGKRANLGRYNCPVAAHLAYVVAADKHFGEFARAA